MVYTSRKSSALVPMLRGALEQVVAQWVVHGNIDDVVGHAQNVLAQTEIYMPEDYIPDEEMALMYANGMSTYEIAEHLNFSYARVYAALKRQGTKFRAKGYNVSSLRKQRVDERVEAMFAMRQQGATLEEIGAKYGITRERVRQLFVAHGKHTERPLRPEEIKAVEEYVNGDSLVEVAERNGYTGTKMRALINKAGYQVRPSPKNFRYHPQTLEKAEKAGKMYRAGHTPAEIAVALDCQPPSIYRFLAIAGVKPSSEKGRSRRNNIKRRAEKEKRRANKPA